MRMTLLPALFAATALLSMSQTVSADEIALPAGATGSAAITTPQRGISMAKVEAKFGAPAERHVAIGQPPITRWDYPTFSVFFEHDHVIHSVVK